MNSESLRSFLSSGEEPLSTLKWLQKKFLPLALHRLNHSDSCKRLALYGGDRIPENERNLTDFRNRISLIIEYEFARVITAILTEAGVGDLFCAYVVANRFPDLEIRNTKGELGLRFEVKCLQSTAEEKSANFSTLRKDIQPSADFIVVFLWDWRSDCTDTQWDRAPYVSDVFIFNASTLATLRDCYWLNKPPSDLGGGYQGFDIRYAVNCKAGAYHEEEGNLGKLLRLWQDGFDYRPGETELMLKTENDYLAFKEVVVIRGFEILARQILPSLSGGTPINEIREGENLVGFESGNLGFIANSRVNGRPDLKRIMSVQGLGRAWLLTDKYDWTCFQHTEGTLKEISKGKKPKYIIGNHRVD